MAFRFNKALRLSDVPFLKNLAKQRALDFGRTDVTHPTEISHHDSILDESMTESSTVVVRTTATKDEMLGKDQSPNDELRTKPRGFFADQFEVPSLVCSRMCLWLNHSKNRSNFEAHYDGTGPEIWRQTNGNVKAFVSGAGERLLQTMNT